MRISTDVETDLYNRLVDMAYGDRDIPPRRVRLGKALSVVLRAGFDALDQIAADADRLAKMAENPADE